jgi:hypothetical protein
MLNALLSAAICFGVRKFAQCLNTPAYSVSQSVSDAYTVVCNTSFVQKNLIVVLIKRRTTSSGSGSSSPLHPNSTLAPEACPPGEDCGGAGGGLRALTENEIRSRSRGVSRGRCRVAAPRARMIESGPLLQNAQCTLIIKNAGATARAPTSAAKNPTKYLCFEQKYQAVYPGGEV